MKPAIPDLEKAHLVGTIYSGLTATTADGKPAHLAIIDDDGNILESGISVAREAWRIAIAVHTNFLRGTGYLTVHSTPPGLPTHQDQAAA